MSRGHHKHVRQEDQPHGEEQEEHAAEHVDKDKGEQHENELEIQNESDAMADHHPIQHREYMAMALYPPHQREKHHENDALEAEDAQALRVTCLTKKNAQHNEMKM